MTDERTSLHREHPHRWDVPGTILVSLGLLVAGQVLPFMEMQKLVFFKEGYSLPRSILSMWNNGLYFLAVVIFLFSIVFPFTKLALLLAIWFMPFEAAMRDRTLHWLAAVGKWSMLDVFVVAVLLVLTQASAMVSATPRMGLYLFAGAILLSMVATMMVSSAANDAGASA